MEQYAAAGPGGLEITPIYGVRGYEDQFITYLAPEWISRFTFVLEEAKRLDLGIDMATGNGWPFGDDIRVHSPADCHQDQYGAGGCSKCHRPTRDRVAARQAW